MTLTELIARTKGDLNKRIIRHNELAEQTRSLAQQAQSFADVHLSEHPQHPTQADVTAVAKLTGSDWLSAYSGKQPGDPVRAVKSIVDAVSSPNPPRHLLLGNAAFDVSTARLESLLKELRAGEAVARAADFPKE